MVPDCGGPWYNLQETSTTHYDKLVNPLVKVDRRRDQSVINSNATLLLHHSLKLSEIVKPGGFIQFGKFLYCEQQIEIERKNYNNFISALNDNLNNNGFTSNIKISQNGIDNYIIARKNRSVVKK